MNNNNKQNDKYECQMQPEPIGISISETHGRLSLSKYQASFNQIFSQNKLPVALKQLQQLTVDPIFCTSYTFLKAITTATHSLITQGVNQGQSANLLIDYIDGLSSVYNQQSNLVNSKHLKTIKNKLVTHFPQLKYHTKKTNLTIANKVPSVLAMQLRKISQQHKQLMQSYIQYIDGTKYKFNQPIQDTLAHLTFNPSSAQQKHDQCFGCMSQYDNQKPLETKGCYSIIDTRMDGVKLQQIISDKACALLNDGGGYLLISPVQKKTNGDITLVGSSYDNQEHIQQWKIWIQTSIKSKIFPPLHDQAQCYYKLNTRAIPIKNYQQYIIVTALIPRKHQMFYIQKKGRDLNTYNPYFLKKLDQNKIQDVCVLKHYSDQYKLLLNLYQQQNKEQYYRKKSRNTYPIQTANNCPKPRKYIQRVFEQYRFLLDNDQEPKIFYGNQSLLITNQKDDKGIDSIKRAFHKKKINLQVSLPYKSYRSTSYKKIWFLSCDINFKTSHQIVDEATNKKYFAYIACSKYLSVKDTQIVKIKPFFEDFQKKFGKDLNYAWNLSQQKLIQTSKQTYDFYFSFDSYNECVFSFIYLQNERIRADFAKQSHVASVVSNSKKKNQIN